MALPVTSRCLWRQCARVADLPRVAYTITHTTIHAGMGLSLSVAVPVTVVVSCYELVFGNAGTRALLPVYACLRAQGQAPTHQRRQALHVLSGKQLIVTLEVVRDQANLYTGAGWERGQGGRGGAVR